MNRIVDRKWTIKFSRDASPVLSCAIGSITLDIYYQYFEKGDERANMPDIAVRGRESGQWLLILDPKMGRSFTKAHLSSVCLRYAAAFRVPLCIVANYFPDEPSNDELAGNDRAMLCHGLRPNNFSIIARAIRSSFAGVGLSLPPIAICILVDASASTSSRHVAIQQAVLRAVNASPDLSSPSAWIGFFREKPPDLQPLDKFLSNPEFPKPDGGTDYKAGLKKGADMLAIHTGKREIWLFGDGESSEGMDTLTELFDQQQIRLLAWTGSNQSIQSLCERTGGRFSRLE